MNEMEGTVTPKFVVCHNGVDVYHLSELVQDVHLVSGQPFCEIFNTEAEAIAFIPEAFRDTVL